MYTSIMDYLTQHQILSNQQYGFRQGHSCETQLINVVKNIKQALEHQKKIHIEKLGFRKAFDTVPHQRLFYKLKTYAISGQILD